MTFKKNSPSSHGIKRYLNVNRWIIFIVVVSLTSLAGEIMNDKFTMLDFEVYYKTASRMLDHSELYSIKEDGHYVYKYSPVAGLLFIPFALINYTAASLLYWLFLTGLLIAGLKTFFNVLEKSDTRVKQTSISTILILAVASVAVHIHREWHLGQVNMLLLISYIFLINAYRRKQTVLFSTLLSISIFIKPFGLIFVPYLILKKQWSKISYSLLFIIILTISPIIFYPSLDQVIHLYQSWQNELVIELNSKQNLLADANHTIFAVVARYTPLKFILTTPIAQKIYQLILLGIIGTSFLFFSRRLRKKESSLKEFSFLVALIPLLAFTSENAFIFELPTIIILVYYFNTLTTLQKVILSIGCLLIGANIYDIVGSEVSTFLISISIYTFGTVMLLSILMLKKSWDPLERSSSVAHSTYGSRITTRAEAGDDT